MKKVLLIVMFMTALFEGFSQTRGISYQAVILSPNAQEIPGVDAQGNILANSAIAIQFTIVDASGSEVFQEYHTTSTDRYGMINLSIGNGTITYNSFNDIVWDGTTKKLKVGIDFSGGSNFSPLSEQNLSYMPQPVSNETAQIINGNTTAITAIETNQTTQNSVIALNTAKVGITTAQATTISNTTGVNTGDQDISRIATNATAITANTAKTGYTDALVSANTDVAANTAKTGITSSQASAITANTAKVGITSSQAAAITANTAKTGYTDVLVSANTDVAANTAKTGITSSQASAITANTAKVGITSSQATAITANTAKTGYTDALVSANTDVAANTAKTGITSSQASAITANTAKVGITSSQAAAITTNTTDIASNVVDLTTNQTVAGDKSFSSDVTLANGNSLRWTSDDVRIEATTASDNMKFYVGNTEILKLEQANLAATFAGDLTVNGMTVGKGGGAVATNTANGYLALSSNTSGAANTAIGYNALSSNTTGSYNTAIGDDADVSSGNLSNATALGNGATVSASNTIQLGNTSVTNVKTSGTITAGAITIPNTDGTANQVLKTDGSGTLAWSTPASSGATNINGLSDALVESNSIYLGKDPSGTTDNANYNVSVGKSALNFITTGDNNVAVGFQSLYANTTGYQNTAIGDDVMRFNTDGHRNTAVGKGSLYRNTTGIYNTSSGAYSLHNNTTGSNSSAFGYKALYSSTGSNNTGIGYQAGDLITTGTNNVIIGVNADTSSNNAINQIVIGHGATGAGDNTVQLGNTDITDVKTSGTVTAGAVTYPNAHGTSDQVLSTTGSGTLTWTTPAAGGPIYKQSRVNQNSATGTADSEIEVGGMAFRYNKESLKIEVIKTTNLESEWQSYNTSLIVNGASQALVSGGILSTYSSWKELNGSFTISGYYNSYEFEMTPYLRGQASDNHSFNIKVLLDGWGIVTLRVIYY